MFMTKKESNRRYYQKHKKELSKKARIYYQSHREKLLLRTSKYRKENPKLISECQKDWYQRNKTKVKAKLRIWRKNNPEQATDKDRRMRLRHKEMYRQAKQKYKHNKRSAESDLTLKIIQQVYDNNITENSGILRCIYCSKELELEEATLEHKQPLSRGDNNKQNNLAIACIGCNCSKGNKTEAEFIIYVVERN